MQIFREKELLRSYLSNFHSRKNSIGFVPTMGALHQGHLSLVAASQKDNEVTVVSIFVNPTQFDNLNDLKKYPNTLEKDLHLLKKINCDAVFVPNAHEMYNNDISSEYFDFGGIENQMEGAFRKGHFDGVGTIVKRLFQLIEPSKAYFGEKDFQQLQIIKRLVEIEKLPIHVIGCPIHRETTGLAMSSRNQRLTAEQQEQAAFIYKTLALAKELFPEKTIPQINSIVKNEFEKHPTLSLEYFIIADETTLLSIETKKESRNPRAFIAAYLNSVRLIDNLSLYN